MNINSVFPSSVAHLSVLLETFQVQANAHVQTWHNHQNKLYRDSRNAAIDAHLMAEVKRMVAA